jgi:mannan endo-1,4-beta-mannosidase
VRDVFPAAFLCALVVTTFSLHAQTRQPDAAPVNANASPAARALLRSIDSISGHATLSGQHNFPNTVSRYSDRVYELTGHYPAVFGQDFGFSTGEDKDSTLGRASMIEEVIRQYRAGSVIALTWHSVRPTDDEPVTFRDSVQGHLTDWEFRQLLTPGTDLNKRWARQVDVIAGYLQELRDAGVPVLFRPYHEMNGNWFWWGGRPGQDGTAALYRQIFDRYVHLHHLNNLIWVWNVNSPSVNAGSGDQYFPGAAYVDVLSMDIYGAFDRRYYDSMVALAGDAKPIALAEVGAMPTLKILSEQPRWSYMMMWSGMAEGSNSPEQLQALFHAPNIINRNDTRLSSPLAATSMKEPADPEATPVAKALLTALDPSSAKRPAVIEFELGGAATISVEEIRAAVEVGKTPLLRWTPSSPTGGLITTPLTNFEWLELITPGTALYKAWLDEINAALPLLHQLETGHIPVLWSPLPEANAPTFWWGARPGPEGSRILIHELHEVLATQDRLHSLIWIWEPTIAAAGVPASTRPAPLEDFYPGPLGVDALMLDVPGSFSPQGFGAQAVAALAGRKPLGLRTAAPLAHPPAAKNFSWMYTAPANSSSSK